MHGHYIIQDESRDAEVTNTSKAPRDRNKIISSVSDISLISLSEPQEAKLKQLLWTTLPVVMV